MITYIKTILYSVFYTIFPRRCLFCNDLLAEDDNKICSRCQKLYPYSTEINIDDFYAPLYPYIANICVLGNYSYTKIAIKEFKFRENLYIGRQLSSLLCDKLQNTSWINSIDMVVPVPLHSRRMRQRGFNQSEVISAIVAKRFHKKLVTDNLVRTVFHKDQHLSNKAERYENVRGVFKVKDFSLFEQKKVLLVDDVITTCSTLLECCKEIKKCQGIEIYVCSLASDREII